MIERVVTTDSVCMADKPVLVSRADQMTLETLEAIGDHNNAFWCACPSQRPEDFDLNVCSKKET